MYAFTLWALVTVWIMASGFEFHSIGENIMKRTGNKPEIFGFFDTILIVVQKKAIGKVEQVFDVLEKEPAPAPAPENEAEPEDVNTNTNTNVNTNQNENTN